MMNLTWLATFFCWTFVISLSGLYAVIQRLLFSGSVISSHRLVVSTFIPVLITVNGYRKQSLNFSGALAAVCVGTILTLGHTSFFLSLLFFFVSGSRATKVKQREKHKIDGDHFKPGGQRNWIQVLCNGGVAMELGLLYLLDVGCGQDLPVDFDNHYRASWIGCAILGSLSCACGDTLASELGSVMSSSDPRLITTLEKVPKGTNGGVTLVGLVCSLLGGAIVGLGYYIGVYMMSPKILYSIAPNQLLIIVVGALAGLLGSLIDSLLGASLQYSGQDENGSIVEKPTSITRHISGIQFLDNHGVNLLSVVIMAGLTPKIAIQILIP